MSNLPHWLPPALSLTFDTGTLDYLLDLFLAEFGPPDNYCYFRGQPVWLDRRNPPHIEALWHVISRTNGQREFDFDRANHLPWCAAIIQNCDEPEVLCWFNKHDDGSIRASLWLEQWNYVVILKLKNKPKGAIYDLVTAFCVDNNYLYRLQKNYENRLPEDGDGNPLA